MSTTVKITFAFLVVTILALALWLWRILGDGGGGPVIVIDPPGDGQSVAKLDGEPAKWRVTCDQQYAEPHGGAGFPPSIPRRFVHTKGVSEVKVIPSGKNISALRMDIKDEGGSLHHVELHVPVPNHWPTWLLDGGVIIGNENRQIHWPKELLGEITSVKFDTSDDEMLGTFDKIEIHYNRAYGRIVDSCN